MEEKCYYLIKAKTAWTSATWFEDGDYWKESLKRDGIPPSSALIKDIFSVTADQSELVEEVKPGEAFFRGLVDEMQDDCGNTERPLTSYNDAAPSSGDNDSLITTQNRDACSIREKIFRAPNALADHLRTHSVERPFACSHCDKSFALKAILKQHLIIHSGVKSYSCSQCSYSCSRKSSLDRHVHNHGNQKPFPCQLCPKSYASSTGLKRHQQVHSNVRAYACSICEKSFTYKYALNQHLLTHTKEKSHACSTCGKSFSLSSSLKSHLIIHTNVKPFACDTCGKRHSDAGVTSINIYSHIQIGMRNPMYVIFVKRNSDTRVLSKNMHV